MATVIFAPVLTLWILLLRHLLLQFALQVLLELSQLLLLF